MRKATKEIAAQLGGTSERDRATHVSSFEPGSGTRARRRAVGCPRVPQPPPDNATPPPRRHPGSSRRGRLLLSTARGADHVRDHVQPPPFRPSGWPRREARGACRRWAVRRLRSRLLAAAALGRGWTQGERRGTRPDVSPTRQRASDSSSSPVGVCAGPVVGRCGALLRDGSACCACRRSGRGSSSAPPEPQVRSTPIRAVGDRAICSTSSVRCRILSTSPSVSMRDAQDFAEQLAGLDGLWTSTSCAPWD